MERNPLDQPIVTGSVGRRGHDHRAGPFVDHAQGLRAVSVARVDHLRRPQATRHHVTYNAMIMLMRGFSEGS